MSGIYIPGMEMPQEENETIIRIQPDGTVLDQYGHHLAVTAVPVPDHGRLIDADALGIRDAEKRAYEAYQMEKHEYFIEEPLLEYKRGLSEGLIHASGLVRFAPTVIPASPAEEEEG